MSGEAADRSADGHPGPSWPSVLAMARAVATRPDLWWTAAGALRRLAAPGWWASPPHLPLPDGRLWEFRMITAYGHGDRVPERADLVSYLEWCRSTTHRGGRRGGPGPVPAGGDRRDEPGSG